MWHHLRVLYTCQVLYHLLARLFRRKSRAIEITGSSVSSSSASLAACKYFNIAYNLETLWARLMKLHTHVHYHKSYILTKGHNSIMDFDRIIPLSDLAKTAEHGIRLRCSCYYIFWNSFFNSQLNSYHVTIQKKRLDEALLLSGHMIGLVEK